MKKVENPSRRPGLLIAAVHNRTPPEIPSSVAPARPSHARRRSCYSLSARSHTLHISARRLKERGVNAADLISFMLEHSFHVIGEHTCYWQFGAPLILAKDNAVVHTVTVDTVSAIANIFLSIL
ncbi:hypothetical protein PIB30_056283 [Stylosanthes scabra]|uniref:Uncharacterized protein n=1 Tax=Stylosanthes scabra TaxID=79078 RepID=A0ABU6VHI0_9FABA|nr:hypothetical protein [Stylosanthes scabra]